MRRSSSTALAVAAAVLAVLSTVLTAPTAASAAPGRPLTVCPGFSGYNHANPYSSLERGYVSILGHTTRLVSSGGSTSWSANPYRNVSWQTWLHSMKWIGDLIYTGSGGHTGVSTADRQRALNLAVAIVNSYRVANPGALSTHPSLVQKNSSGHRAQTLGCLVETLGGNAPAWLVQYANATAAWLTSSRNYLGAWNQGLDQDLGAIAITCVTGYTKVRDAAVNRAAATMAANIDPQGATNEQSVGYGVYGYALWTKVITTMNTCNITPPSVIDRVNLVPDFLAWASTPSGRLEQIGDTTYDPTPDIAKTAAASFSALGAPNQLVKVYGTAGYVFGRSSWSNLPSSMYYSLRFGPKMALHGHSDKTSVTYWVRGRQILTDSGHIGYADTAARNYLRSTAAHNALSTPPRNGLRQGNGAATLLKQWQVGNADGYTVVDKSLGLQLRGVWYPYRKVRSVVVLRNPDVMIVLDAVAGGAKSQVWTQRWHLAPGVARAGGSSSRATFNNGTTIYSVPVATTAHAKVTVGTSWVARTTGHKTPDLQAVVTATGRHAQFLTIIAPSAGISYRYSAGQLTIVYRGVNVATLLVSSTGILSLPAPPVS